MDALAPRPLAALGVALVGAGVIANAPAVVPAAPAIPHVSVPEIALQASIIDLFKFPILRQIAANQVEVLAIETQAVADAGRGAGQSLLQLPPALLTATRQVLSRNPLDALTTMENWAVDSAKATFVPVIAGNVEVGQIDLAIQSALLPARPLALVSAASGLFDAADLIIRGLTTAGQDFVRAVLTFNIQNIVQAIVSGVQGVVTSIGAGVQAAVDGVVGAQNLIADALAARPVQPPAAASLPTDAAPALAAAVVAPQRVAPKAAASVESIGTEAPAAIDATPAPQEVAAKAAAARPGTAVADIGTDVDNGTDIGTGLDTGLENGIDRTQAPAAQAPAVKAGRTHTTAGRAEPDAAASQPKAAAHRRSAP